MEVAVRHIVKEIVEPREMQRLILNEKKSGKRIGVVPTMGYLHAGHTALIREARKENDIVVLTIFVNPAQFGPDEDFERYPRDIEKDRSIAAAEDVDYIFHPDLTDMYQEGYATYIDISGVTEPLEGTFRPGHFRGVATIVLKLFEITQPDNAYFGQKDAQQLAVIQKMVRDLHIPVTVRPVPTVREPDGLAMSSRNAYLSAEERKKAAIVYEALKNAAGEIYRGVIQRKAIIDTVYDIISTEKGIIIDYVEVVDPETFRSVDDLKPGNKYCIAIAVRIGKTRLIDNIFVS